jgi:hypothetical protein
VYLCHNYLQGLMYRKLAHLVGSALEVGGCLEGCVPWKGVCLGGRMPWTHALEGACLGGRMPWMACLGRAYALEGEGVCLGGRRVVFLGPWTEAWGVMLSPQAHRHKSCD